MEQDEREERRRRRFDRRRRLQCVTKENMKKKRISLEHEIHTKYQYNTIEKKKKEEEKDTVEETKNVEKHRKIEKKTSLSSKDEESRTNEWRKDTEEFEYREGIRIRQEEVIGLGTFSVVRKGRIKHRDGIWKRGETEKDGRVALKIVHKNSDPTRIQNECCRLRMLGGKRHVVELLGTCRRKDTFVFVFPYHRHDKFRTIMENASSGEVAEYMRQLFVALEHVHERKVIHRDVKPGNFLYSMKDRRGVLVDFGLAEDDRSEMVRGAMDMLHRQYRDNASGERNKISAFGCQTLTGYRRRGRGASNEDLSLHVNSKATSSSLLSLKRKRSIGSLNHRSTRFSRVGALRQMSANLNAPDGGDNKQRLRISGTTGATACRVCNLLSCQGVASKAGTPGFRAPEVLARSIWQTTAVDIWSAGIIFASLLTGRYPFFPFRSDNDAVALSEILAVLGDAESESKIAEDFASFHKHIELVKFDRWFATASSKKGSKSRRRRRRLNDWEPKALERLVYSRRPNVPKEAIDLLYKLLRLSPASRPTASEALRHPFFALYSGGDDVSVV